MVFWHKYPFIRFITPFIAGILTALWIFKSIDELIYLLAILVSVYLLINLIFGKKIPYKYRWVTGLLLNFVLLVSGYQLTILNTPRFQRSDISNQDISGRYYIVQLIEPLSEKPNSFKAIGRVKYILNDKHKEKVTGKIMLYFEKDDMVQNLEYGDRLLLSSQLQEISKPQNPGEFNYKKYLSNKGIYLQGYVASGDWKVIKRNAGNIFKSAGIQIRERFMAILEDNGILGEEFAVASAILLGYDDKLDADQKQAFSGAGAMHILCVSGLHVGIISIILSSALFFLNRGRWLRFLKVILLLILIWFYALITGFSPSVMRASIMFSFLIIGQSLRRRTEIYNTLAASAFLLLLINPYILLEVGFQLSYLAVIGIVWLYRPISRLYYSRFWLVRKVWEISVVSFAATLATFPISLFYFHQFPALFLLTNLVAIPASMIIIYLGIFVLAFSIIPILSETFAFFLVKVIWFLNSAVKSIEGLSFSTVQNIYLTIVELILIFILLIMIIRLLEKRSPKIAMALITLTFLIIVSFTWRGFTNMTQKQIIVYNIRNHTAIDFIEGSENYLFSDSVLKTDQRKIQYHVQGNWIRCGLKKGKLCSLNEELGTDDKIKRFKNFYLFANKSLLVINRDFRIYKPHEPKLKVDFILISQNAVIGVDEILQNFEFETLVFDSSNSNWYTRKWAAACRDKNIPYHSVAENGAWIKKI